MEEWKSLYHWRNDMVQIAVDVYLPHNNTDNVWLNLDKKGNMHRVQKQEQYPKME